MVYELRIHKKGGIHKLSEYEKIEVLTAHVDNFFNHLDKGEIHRTVKSEDYSVTITPIDKEFNLR